MLPDDTIVALSSAAGPGARAIVRLSGPEAWRIFLTLLARRASERNVDSPEVPVESGAESKPPQRTLSQRNLKLPGIHSPFPADVYFFPSPATYTGQDIVELHTIGSPPLVEILITACLQARARAAQPGEFTQRAFLAGKLDLTQAEAVLGVIEASSRKELKQALTQLAGGLGRPLEKLRDDLLNLLADVEAALDFSDEDISFVQQADLLKRLALGLALLTNVKRQLDSRSLAPRPFRVALAGPANVGKSSLFNALVGADAALVSPQAGTTRDYLEAELKLGDITVQLLDTAGLGEGDSLDRAAQALGREQLREADLVLWCQEACSKERDIEPVLSGQVTRVITKSDLSDATRSEAAIATSVLNGTGLIELKKAVVEFAKRRTQPPLAPSLSRCRHHVESCLGHLRAAHTIVLDEDPPEILALEVRSCLEELGAIVGAVYTDDLLDRIFSRFCIGK